VLSPIALSGIKAAITRQIQPCADRQVNPGPGANEIQVTLNIRLNPDGSLAARPTVVRTTASTTGTAATKSASRTSPSPLTPAARRSAICRTSSTAPPMAGGATST
jgi:hypothetical protein